MKFIFLLVVIFVMIGVLRLWVMIMVINDVIGVLNVLVVVN